MRSRGWGVVASMVIASLSTSAAVQAQGGLKIVVIAGEDAVNIIQQKTAVAPVVEVRDRNNLPVSGVAVTFSVAGQGGSFGGLSTLTVTTNAAGQAAAAGFTPTAAGAIQINASALVQGQALTATITQTNVLTAAQAVAAGASGGAGGSGGASTGGAAVGGGGGGISGTTIGIIGAAVGGGAIAATKVAGGGDDATSGSSYSGSFAGQLISTFNSVNNVPGCVITRAIAGTLKMTIEQRTDGSVSGMAAISGTDGVVGSSCETPVVNNSFNRNAQVTGSASSLAFRQQSSTTNPAPQGATATSSQTGMFSGALNGSVVTGTMTFEESFVSQGGTTIALTSSGSVTFPITLNKG